MTSTATAGGRLTANRLLTFLTNLTAIGAVLTAVAGALPVGQTQATIIAVAGLLTALGNTLHFQRGAQKADALDPGDSDPDAAFTEDGLPDIPASSPVEVPPDEVDSPRQPQLGGGE